MFGIGWLFPRKLNGSGNSGAAVSETDALKLVVITPIGALAPHAGRLEKIWRAVRLSEESRPQLYDAPVLAFAEHVLNLPASRAYHDAGAGGLLEHTLKTAERAAAGSAELPLIVPQDHPLLVRYQERYRAYLAFLAALLHDLGKVFAMRVSPAQRHRREILARQWDPMDESLAAFLARCRAREYTARFEPLEEGEHHEALGLLLYHRIVTPAIVRTVTRRGALSVLSFLLRGVRVERPDSDGLPFQPERSIVDRPIEAAVTAADRRATAQATAPQPTVQPTEPPLSQSQPPTPADEHAVQNRRRLEILLEELRRTLRGGGFKINSPTGHIQCGARFTFVSLSGPLHTAASAANERMLAEHLAGVVKNARHGMLFDLLARTGSTYAAGSETRNVVFRATIGSHLSGVGGILFPNEILWQDASGPSDYTGITTEVCEFFEAKKEGGPAQQVPGFISAQPMSTSFRAAIARLCRKMRDGKVKLLGLDKPDAQADSIAIVLERVVLVRPSAPAGQDPLAGLASRVQVYLGDQAPAAISALILPRAMVPPATRIQQTAGHFRFVPCAP